MAKNTSIDTPIVGFRYVKKDDPTIYIPFFVDFTEVRYAPEGSSREQITTPAEFLKDFSVEEIEDV